MKKAILIIAAIAILGSLGIYSRGHKSNSFVATTSSQAQGSASVKSAASSPVSSTVGVTPKSSSGYRDGTYKGDAADTPYGTVQIAAVITNGQISDISFLQMPFQEGHSQQVTADSEPQLKSETLQKQSANIDFISGATSTVYGYQESLQAALDQAKIS